MKKVISISVAILAICVTLIILTWSTISSMTNQLWFKLFGSVGSNVLDNGLCLSLVIVALIVTLVCSNKLARISVSTIVLLIVVLLIKGVYSELNEKPIIEILADCHGYMLAILTLALLFSGTFGSGNQNDFRSHIFVVFTTIMMLLVFWLMSVGQGIGQGSGPVPEFFPAKLLAVQVNEELSINVTAYLATILLVIVEILCSVKAYGAIGTIGAAALSAFAILESFCTGIRLDTALFGAVSVICAFTLLSKWISE